jgi:hypothetical protein
MSPTTRISFSLWPYFPDCHAHHTQRDSTVYLKEVTYTSQSREGLSQANRLIKELQKRHRTREQERKEQEVCCGAGCYAALLLVKVQVVALAALLHSHSPSSSKRTLCSTEVARLCA